MLKYKFPDNFIWGTGTSSYQVEGAYKEDGKGESIWDRFTHLPGRIVNGYNGDVACDHYHKYSQDIKLLKELGVNTYRFSISWPRIFPQGKGMANIKGMDFYKRVIALLQENGIRPMVTLYHWDLPQKHQDIGGWANRDITQYFEEYARCVFENLGDSVAFWNTHNEPGVAAFAGYGGQRHAPALNDFNTGLQVSHHILLSHGKAVSAFRELGLKGEIGITIDAVPAYPYSEKKEDIEAARRHEGFKNSWFADPIFKGSYPKDILDWFSQKGIILPTINAGDMEIINTPIDFIGTNYYRRNIIKNAPEVWPMQFKDIIIDREKTDGDWPIYPKGLYGSLKQLHNDFNGVKIFIMENGASFNDIVDRNGRVEDTRRIDYLHNHIIEAHKAIGDGVNLAGYFVWSFLDLFEWPFGYSRRFGLVHVNHETQERIIKSSGYWYKEVIKNNGLD